MDDDVRELHLNRARRQAERALRGLEAHIADVRRNLAAGGSPGGSVRNMGADIADLAWADGVIEILTEGR